MRHVVVPPVDEAELIERCDRLAGRTLAEVAAERQVPVPRDLRRDKGWIGQLVESVLGATAQSRAEPDFPELGVELKTVPVSAAGVPLQSTYVCTAPLDGSLVGPWEESWVRNKLSRVLWLPVVGAADVAVGDRVIGSPLLWSPDADEDAALRADWDDLTGLLARGELWQLDARHGQWLQIRPKGGKGRELVWTLDDDGEWVRDTPRGFYLRARFTRRLFERHYRLG